MSRPSAQRGDQFGELVSVMQRLLASDGCPWDREQTLETLKPYLVEETFEVLEALERGTAEEHCEELGDLLMQIVFQAELRAAEGAFGIDDVCRGIAAKLIRRHPHVFADADAKTSDQVVAQWEEIKAQEKGVATRVLDGVAVSLPALARAQKISSRAARVGFDWPDVKGCRAKVAEELDELDRAVAAGVQAQVEAELGDLLYAAVSLARKLGVDAETALRKTVLKFIGRFEFIEDRLRESGRSWEQADLDELDALWNRAKAAITSPSTE
jgi:tetrapyrrole methylase family protein/MazG family protein/ATP diphosphatase